MRRGGSGRVPAMRRTLLAALLLAVLFGRSERSHAESPPACALKLVLNVPVLSSRYGSILVPANLNGHDTHLILDTGAFWSVVTQSIAGGLTVFDADNGAVGMGGREARHFVRIRNPSIGAGRLPHADFYVEPDAMATEPGIGGNLAVNVLSLWDLEIDPANAAIDLYAHDRCPGRVVHWPHDDFAAVRLSISKSGLMTIPVTLDGQTLWALIDTGAAFSVVESRAAQEKFGLKPGDAGMTESGYAVSIEGTRIPVSRHQFKSLALDGIAFSNPTMLIGVDESSHLARLHRFATEEGSRIPDMLLGMRELRLLHLYFAFKEIMLYVTSVAGDATAAKAEAKTNVL